MKKIFLVSAVGIIALLVVYRVYQPNNFSIRLQPVYRVHGETGEIVTLDLGAVYKEGKGILAREGFRFKVEPRWFRGSSQVKEPPCEIKISWMKSADSSILRREKSEFIGIKTGETFIEYYISVMYRGKVRDFMGREKVSIHKRAREREPERRDFAPSPIAKALSKFY